MKIRLNIFKINQPLPTPTREALRSTKGNMNTTPTWQNLAIIYL